MASVRRDFFLDPAYRLTEQERALMTAMLHDLLGTVAGEILSAAQSDAGPGPDATVLAKRLTAAGLLDREELVGLLVRRADEHRISGAFAARAGARKLPLLPALVGDSNGEVAAAAMALVIARGRRRDAFGQPRVELADLSPVEALAIAFAIAAAIAGPGSQEQILAQAAAAVASGHPPSESLDAAVAGLADSLEGAGRLDDSMIEAAAEEGEASLLAGLLARRSGISVETAWGYLIGGQEEGLALLARMAGLGRPAAARLIAEFGVLSGASVEDEIARFDNFTAGEVDAGLAWWRLPAEFRLARRALGGGNG